MYQIKNKEMKFSIPKLDEITIFGFSKSKYKTGYLIKPWNIYLDAGLPSPIPPNLILLSHGHEDHIAGLYSLLIEGNKTPVVLPTGIKYFVQNLLNCYSSLNSGKKSNYKNWIPITDNYFKVNINNQTVEIKTYNLDHSVPCLGYSIDKISKKLKQEYKKLSGIELKEIKKSIDIFEEKKIPIILFISDTGKSILDSLPFNNYPIVIIECTFFEEEHYEEATKRKHLHWKDLLPIIQINTETKFILGHFSCRYDEEYLYTKSKEIMGEYKNVIFWI